MFSVEIDPVVKTPFVSSPLVEVYWSSVKIEPLIHLNGSVSIIGGYLLWIEN